MLKKNREIYFSTIRELFAATQAVEEMAVAQYRDEALRYLGIVRELRA
jgi:hypothetical protein